MIKSFCLLALTSLFLPGLAHAQGSERDVRNQTKSLAAAILLSTKNVDALERMADEFRTTKAKTPAGLWKLTFFYEGIEDSVESVNRRRGQDGIDEILKTIDEWERKYPQSASAKLAKGVVLQKRAWLIRGHGYSSTVAPEAWKHFREAIAEARTYFDSVKASASTDPVWYCQMSHIAKAQHWPRSDFDRFVSEVLNRHPDYHQAIFCSAEYLAPRWYFESTQALEKFADQAVAATQSTDGKSLYARIYWAVSDGEVDTKVFGEKFYMWPKVRAGFDDLLARYPDPWNLNHYAKFSCLVGDGQNFKKLAERIGQTPLNYVMPPPFFDRCKQLFGVS